jgi:hypothetical protein
MHASLSSSLSTPTNLEVLLTDRRDKLRILAERQKRVYMMLETALGRF